MKYKVSPAGMTDMAISELQSLNRRVVSGATANTAVAISDMKANAVLFSVIGFDSDAAAQADQVVDFTGATTVSPISKAVAGITLVPGATVKVTITAHGLVTGDYVKFSNTVGGTTQLRNKGYVISVVDANTIALQGTLSGDFTPYTSGGNVFYTAGAIKCTSDTSAYRLMIDFFNTPEA